jgi:hypothetical protein
VLTKTTLQECITEWLRTTQRNKWEVFVDGTDVWIQYGTEIEVEGVPHYMIDAQALKVIVCCPVPHDNEWELHAGNPKFFELLAEKMDVDEARVERSEAL